MTCSQRCRQARHRFGSTITRAVASGSPRRLAYADPPYPGNAAYYRDHPDFAGEVDHAALIRRLATYDGWALSTSAEALPQVLEDASCCAGVRVAAWHRGPRLNRRAMRPLSAWEPVIYCPGRPLDPSHDLWVADSLVYVARARTTDPARVIGAKPAAFIDWIFRLLGARGGDSLDDLFPGSGGVGRAWDLFTRRPSPRCDTSPDVDHDDSSLGDEHDASGAAACDTFRPGTLTRLADQVDA